MQSKSIQNLKEHTDFKIKVEVEEDTGGCSVQVLCKCGVNLNLPCRNYTVTISNWTRHLHKSCKALHTINNKTKQVSMAVFLPNITTENTDGMTNSSIACFSPSTVRPLTIPS
jgi:hypothetical protein